MPKYKSKIDETSLNPTSKLMRSLYEYILATDHETHGSSEQIILDAIKRHHYAELNAFARILQNTGQKLPKGDLSSIRAILIKPVNDACNLRCTYCYEGTAEARSSGKVMSKAEIKSIISEVLTSPHRDIQFLWHGGEPLLAGIDFYRYAIEVQKTANVHGTVIYNAFQTNGLLLDSTWIEFIRENKIGVSLSLDGSKYLHDINRIDSHGKGTHSRVLTAINLLQEENMDFNVISVIGSQHEGRAADYWSFIKNSNIKNFDIHPSNGIGASEQSPIHPEKFSTFVNSIFDYWLNEGDTNIRIGLFDDFFRLLSGNPPQTCYHAGVCSDIIAVEGNGSVIPCTRPFDRSKYTFGNIHTENLASIIASDRFKSFKKMDLYSQSLSKKCRWYELCHNGCPQQRTTNGKQDVSGAGYYCQCRTNVDGGYFKIWDHAYKKIEEIFSTSTINPHLF